jgi:hypothetical protein
MRQDFLRDNPLCAGPDSECQREGRVTAATIRDHRVPLAEGGLTLVAGPPGSGKTTYVRDRAGANDLIIDLDRIIAAMSGQPEHQTTDRRWLPLAVEARNDLLRSLATDTTHPAAWFCTSAPGLRWREQWARRLGAEVVVLAPRFLVCVDRLMTDRMRAPEQATEAIEACREWYAQALA